MYGFFVVIIVIASVLITIAVLLQNSKGGGLASNFGAGNTTFGVRQAADILEKSTWILAAVIIVFSIAATAAISTSKGTKTTSAKEILEKELYKGIEKSRYTDDKKITDHYAIIPTGQGLDALGSLGATQRGVYDRIVRRFLAIFYPPAVYRKLAITLAIGTERFFSNLKVLEDPGYLVLYGNAEDEEEKKPAKKGEKDASEGEGKDSQNEDKPEEATEEILDADMFEKISTLKKGMRLPVSSIEIREGETKPPKRYNSGSLILAMENAGQLIEDEELRAQIKGSGIGTSATRAEILNKLVKIMYLNLNRKTQIVTPTKQGEMIYEIVAASIRSLLNAELTASWEKGLTGVAEGRISETEYMEKLEGYVSKWTDGVKGLSNQGYLIERFRGLEPYYK